MPKRINLKDRHIRWNWQQSPDDESKVRYHIVVVDNKRREAKINSITEQIQTFSSVESIRKIEGKVKGSPHRYLFESFDTVTKPAEIDFTRISSSVTQDKELYERQATTGIENYVATLFTK